MRSSALILVLAALIALGRESFGSEEDMRPFRSFRFECPAIKPFGVAVVSGTQTESGVDSVHIEAFGRSFTLPPGELAKLRGFVVNGAQISWEAGYPQLGGHTLNLVFSAGFTSTIRPVKIVSVNEHGDITVRDAKPR